MEKSVCLKIIILNIILMKSSQETNLIDKPDVMFLFLFLL